MVGHLLRFLDFMISHFMLISQTFVLEYQRFKCLRNSRPFFNMFIEVSRFSDEVLVVGTYVASGLK